MSAATWIPRLIARILRVVILAGLGFTFAVAVATPTQAQEISYTYGVGGEGGGLFGLPCAVDNQVVVGIRVRSGKAMDAIQPFCQQATGSGHIVGPIALAPSWAGGNGGNVNDINCEPDQAIISIEVAWDSTGKVHHITGTCQAITGGLQTFTRTTTNTGGATTQDDTTACKPGSFASGLTGYSDNLIEKIGMRCTAYHVADAGPATPKVVTPKNTEIKGKDSDFAGVWETIIPAQNAKFRITIRLDGQNATAELINEQDPLYNGTLVGTIAKSKFTYTMDLPAAGSTGKGFFYVTAGGTINGFLHPDSSPKETYDWEGTRIGDAPAGPTPPDDNQPNQPNPPAGDTRTVGGGGTTVYDKPDGNELAQLNPGDEVTIVSCGQPEGFCKISKPTKGLVWEGDLQ